MSVITVKGDANVGNSVTCACCGLPGGAIGEGDERRIRCRRHEDVIDVGEWRARQDAIPVMFKTEEEALAHFLADYGAGLDMMKELAADEGRDPEETKH